MNEARRATIYFEPRLQKALKLKAVETDRSLSDLVNEAVRQSLMEDAIDLEAFEQRKNQRERSFESFVKELKKDGLL